ncbi:Protein RocB [Koleobacter methoxysyntrophicus]|uniref:Protein RocB n=1 Tax=Koleobacter methoxysyntrophicus TaxID=2751313 RepID=A0A8A0RKP2_9FIRM|nr:M20/M25/M40 family metallo-hydrolase [Koleobacter methoxysyntrophicus]QSQ08284.1 Protein RocB [Koleobacter methoxysyntrophicus]
MEKRGFYERVKELTVKLVECPSIMGTPGERKIAELIYEEFSRLEYFKTKKENLRFVPVPDDHLGRKCVFALIEGEKNPSKETVVLLGHIDTVRIEDFGKLKPFAFSPERLKEELSKLALREDVLEDIKTGEWLFGRGSYDMKSGVAAHMAVIERLSRETDNLSGNVLFVGAPDEEDMSSGALAAVKELRKMQEQGYEFISLINADYTSPRYPKDPHYYVYLGTVGKLLPSFFITGRETHVGQSFEGFDSNQLAAELTRLIDMNTGLCDEAEGEVPPPPISLKVRDLKEKYDVQTPFISQAYYNFFTHKMSPSDVMDRMKEIALKAFENTINRLNEEYKKYCQICSIPYEELPWKPLVYSYEDFYRKVMDKAGPVLKDRLEELHDQLLADPDIDLREHSLRIVEEIWKWSREAKDKVPCIVIYFSSAFSPRVYMKGERPEEMRLIEAVRESVQKISEETGTSIKLKKFYPYISDMSFFAVSDDSESVEVLKKNMPGWGKKYTLDIEDIRALNIPMVNIGPHGKDAHKITERVYMPYSFEAVPKIIYDTVKRLLGR